MGVVAINAAAGVLEAALLLRSGVHTAAKASLASNMAS